MDRHLTIGRFARLTELSARTLRKYDRSGLLSPAIVDPQTKYRLYGLDQVPRAVTTRLLRSLDVPLGEIAAILDGDDPQAGRGLLEHQIGRIEERIARDRHTLLRLEAALARGGPLGTYRCELRDLPAVTVFSQRRTCPRATIDDVVTETLARLHDHARRHDILVTGREIVLYHGDLTREDDYDVEVCLPTATLIGESGNVGGRTLGVCAAAVTHHHGPFEDLRAAYCALAAWIIDNGLERAGPQREVFPVDERDTDDPREYVSEIMWPVVPATHSALPSPPSTPTARA